MRIEHGVLTVGDIGIEITAELGETLTGLNIDFEFLKPDESTIMRDASSLSGTEATYETASGDIDQAGDWYIYVLNVTTGFYYNRESGHHIHVRPKPADMARAR